MILIPTASDGNLIMLETDRRLLYSKGALVGRQKPAVSTNGVVEAFPWEFEGGFEKYLDVVCSLHDEPQLPIIPAGPSSVYHIHSIQLVDELALENDNQFIGVLLDDNPSYWITATTNNGLEAFLLSDGLCYDFKIMDNARLEREWGLKDFSNFNYMKSAIRSWLRESLGPDWEFFK